MLSQDSEVKIKAFMCSSDPSAAWHAYMRDARPGNGARGLAIDEAVLRVAKLVSVIFMAQLLL